MQSKNMQFFSTVWRSLFIFALLLASLAGCSKDEPDGLMADALPYREELADYEARLQKYPDSVNILVALSELKLNQAVEADWSIRPGLLREARAYLQKALEHSDVRSLDNEYIYHDLAHISALLGGSLKDKKESAAAFKQGWEDYQKMDQAAVLRRTPGYSPGLGWANVLLYSADRLQGKTKSVERIQAEFMRLIMDEGFIKADHPSQRMLWAEILLTGASKYLNGKVQEQLFDKGLAEANKATDEVLALAASEHSYSKNSDLRTGMNRVNLFTTVALLQRSAAASDAKKQQEYLVKAHDTLCAYFVAAGHWPGYEAKEFVAGLDPKLWSKLNESLPEDPLLLSAHGMWSIMFPDDKKDKKFSTGKALLDKSLELAPTNERVLGAYVAAMRLDSYDSPWYKEDKLPMYERLACLQQGDASGWFYWSDSYQNDLAWPGDAKFAEKKAEMLARIDALDAELSCPSFSTYARGMVDKRAGAKAYLEVAAHLEKAATLPHPKAAGELIYGELGLVWRNAFSQNYLKEHSGKKSTSAEEYLEVLTKAHEALGMSLQIGRELPLEQKAPHSPYRQALLEVYAALLACPARDIDTALLEEIKSHFAPGEKLDDKLWSRSFVQVLQDARSQLRKFSGSNGIEERRAQLYDLSIETLEANPAQGENAKGMRQKLAAQLHERAMLDPAGQRGTRLKKALKIYEELQGEKMNGHHLAELALIKLRLASEVESEEIAELLNTAYADFCLAAGLPEASTRARLSWAKTLEDEAEKQTPQGAEVLRTRAMRISSAK